MKKKLLLLPLMMLVLNSCSLFGGSSTDPSNSGPTDSDPSDTGSDSTDPSGTDDVVEYTVSFDLNYPNAVGTPVAQVVQKNQLVTKPTDPTRDDFTFLHWSEGMYSGVAWDFANTGVTRNMTLYASWEYNDVDPEPVTKTYYVRTPSYWLSDNHTVALYAWDEATEENNLAWPGDKMTHVSGQIYSYDVQTKFTHIIFARVTATGEEPALEVKAQTEDLPIANLSNPEFDFYWINNDVRYGDNKCQGLWSIYPNEPNVPTPNPEVKTYYVHVPEYWLADNHTIALYAWIDGTDDNNLTWPGDKMTHVDGRIYSYEVDEKFTHIIFARVTATGEEPALEVKAQTGDLPITNLANPDFDFYWINEEVRYGENKCQGLWAVYPNEPDAPTPLPGKLYYVQIPTYWTSDGGVAGVYMWDDNDDKPAVWPGQLMNLVSDRLYSFEIPAEYVHFIFVRVSPSGADWGAQTGDLTHDMAGEHNLYTISEDVVWGGNPGCQGVWSTYTA